MATTSPPGRKRGLLSRLLPQRNDGGAPPLVGPIRGELFGADRLAEHARAIAREQRLEAMPTRRALGPGPLLSRLAQSRRILDDSRHELAQATDRGVDISPAGEWLLDNWYVILEHIREIGASMPRGFYRELPKLAAGPLAGYPRVYELAIELIAHTEGRLELSTIDLFTREFQRASVLTVGELWAIPTMLRLGLVENIRRMALRVVARMHEVELADSWARRLREASEHDPQSLANELAAFVNAHPPLTAPFVTRFLQQIRSYQTDFTPLVWLEQWMAEDGMSHEAAAASSNQRLAITQITVANSITSLRAIARLDWQGFVESQSVVEQTLREDPAAVHGRMTFSTRDHYRHVVERIAKRTRRPEAEVARSAIALAQEAAHGEARTSRRAHVGYYLIGDGLADLERLTGYVPAIGERVHRWILKHALPMYFGAIVALFLALLALLLSALPPVGAGAMLAVMLIALVPASEVAINAVNQLVTWLLPPRILPKLDMREHEIPADCRTAIVVPTILPSVEGVEEALEHLEIQYLANRERHLHFALLSDFTDAPSETVATDDAILAAAVKGIHDLNDRYAGGSKDVFYLFHRPRRWNERQRAWMGWERKRGKLAEFNAFLRGGAESAFTTVIGDVETIRACRFVITLDSDTVLPHDAAQSLIGGLAHPLNRPVFDEARRVVEHGYAILQPRVGVSLTSAHRSRFAAIHSGHPGVDPYTTAVSDVYQDLFGEGSYTGKGIYDVDAFEHATRGRFPENALLSHDLIESAYARAALVTDIEVFDDYPTRYLTYTRRKHRWIRGDWQLLPWLSPRVPTSNGRGLNVLGTIERWKILDNLRRSTVEMGQLGLFVLGWFALPGSPWFWTFVGLTAVAFPWLFTFLLAVVRPPRNMSWRAYYAAVLRDGLTSLQQLAIALVFLLHQAVVSADAIGRTLWRLFVSRRNLLEWQTASQTERITPGRGTSSWQRMAPAVVVGVIIAAAIVTTAIKGMPPYVPSWEEAPGDRGAWVLFLMSTLPLAIAWIAAPHQANTLSTPAVRREFRLTPEERAQSMRYALLHWRFFERFVTPETHYLAPDNFQEDPEPVVAPRTSPTNIGLQLLAIVSAYDLGFITRGEMIERLEQAFRSLERMRRFRGHFYNWYELSDLRVLEPAYVSTVDSGNLAGCMLALRQACAQIPNEPAFDTRIPEALQAALTLAEEATRAPLAAGRVGDPVAWRAVTDSTRWARALRTTLAREVTPSNWVDVIVRVARESKDTAETLRRASATRDALAQSIFWLEWTVALAERHLAELAPLAKSEPAASLRSLADSPVVSEQIGRLGVIGNRAHAYAMEMDFRFLFDERRKLFSIGYDVARGGLDNSFYDLLASEARLASFLAIAKDDVPVEHWFRMGRTLTHRAGATALVSWSGSMFEYLMPLLVMRSYPFTLLEQTYQGAVRRHMAYAQEWKVPWGISESAYNVRDRLGTYQYRAFGVPDLALKRGLAKDLVVAPYASLLAMHVDPHAALRNAASLEQLGALGAYGFRDAIDWTRPDGDRFAIVRAFMAHHLGMGLASLANALTQAKWQRRFHADPMVRAAELLLFERIPRRFVWQEAQQPDAEGVRITRETERPAVREFETADTPQPRIALLGNTPYATMITAAGSGYSRASGLAVTRWRNDGTRDHLGQFCYVHDITNGRAWSVAHQPTGAAADSYRAVFALDRVMFHRQDGELETTTEIAVVPDDGAEVRRVIVTNRSGEEREVELTSYAEVVIGSIEGDRAHPAFANLFVQTEWLPEHSAILASRRPRSSTEKTLWGAHVLAVESEHREAVSCETDRARFLGRGLTPRLPMALQSPGPLSNTTGAVLDPVFALRVRVTIPAGGSARVAFTTLMAETRERVVEMLDRYDDPYSAQRALDLSWTRTQVELRGLGISLADASLYQELAGHLLYGHTALRPSPVVTPSRPSLPALWGQGISGDWPILLAVIEGPEGIPTVRQLVEAHYYLRLKGMVFDLVLVNMRATSYLQELNDQIMTTVMASPEAGLVDRPGGIHVRRRELIGDDDWAVFRAVARVHVRCDGTGLATMLDLPDAGVVPPPNTENEPTSAKTPLRPTVRRGDSPPLEHGLDERGNYRMTLTGSTLPPAPWANVIANERAGCCITEVGGGYAWVDNSQYFRLTPWSNDPVSDAPGEVLYLRDQDTGEVWTPTPAPIRHETPYVVTHGAGFSTFTHEHGLIESVLHVGVAERDPVKVSRLRLTNRGRKRRRLTLTYFVEWTLGVQREHTQHQVVTRYDRANSAVMARNTTDPQFAGLVAFAALSETASTWTADRREFLGRHGDAGNPAALRMPAQLLNEMAGAAIDPCAALQCTFDLKPGETRDVVAILGAERGDDAVRTLLTRYRDAARAAAELDAQVAAWDRRLSAIVVRTPEPSLDVMVNRWLLYQALACRVWGRSAVYQSSGAYGFRDQLQDVMALVYSEPSIAREHILRAASRQFVEGDVQHWWHPPEGRGIRTRFSDDLAWLPLVVDHYVRVTGDATVLDEVVPFLEMRLLAPDEHEVFDLPRVSSEQGSVYEHCIRALRRAATTGEHGLPLMGSGDWNDGMNRVGIEGQGESVWMAWFLTAIMRAFAPHAKARGDADVATWLESTARDYTAAVEAQAWDGAWYRRAYFDDGTPLGSHRSDECKIDSIAQTWAVISGAADAERARVAMASLEQDLVDNEHGIIKLLTPPFDKTANDPGYIKGYLPGVRENGAQYTHAALWVVLATAMMRNDDRALALWQMINPLSHTRDAPGVLTYKVEPYVVAADVYTAEGHVGRGGWTWYTGSASWMYRVALEAILGFRKEGNELRIEPCVPRAWSRYSIQYRHGTSVYAIEVRLSRAEKRRATRVTVDGVRIKGDAIPLVDDGNPHAVMVEVGRG